MPSSKPIPVLGDILQAYRDGIIGQKERRADVHDGAGYDLLGGMAAMLWSRQAQRDRDLFRADYFDTAENDELTNRGNALYGIPRILDTYGTGLATLARPNATAGGGTIPTGTRLLVYAPTGTSDPHVFAVTQDTPVGANSLQVIVPVRSTVLGVGTALTITAIATLSRIDDPIFDNSWTVSSIQTQDGTTFEPADVYRARIRATRLAQRVGYVASIVTACQSVGATNVVSYPSNWVGDSSDFGLNYLYVADASFNGAQALVNAVTLALEGVRVLGADLQILPLTSTVLPVSVTASLWDDPGQFDTVDITTAIQAAIGAYFDGRKNAYAYQIDGIAGAVINASTAVQGVTVNTPTSSVGVTVTIGGLPNFPAVLTRYTVNPANIAVAFTGPT